MYVLIAYIYIYSIYICNNMGSIKVLKNPRTISVIVEGNDHEYVKDHVPDFSKWLREQEKQYKEGLEMEKKGIALHNKGAIKLSGVGNSDIVNILDKYFPYWIQNFKDWEFRKEIFESCTDDLQHKIMIMLNRTTESWHVMIKNRQRQEKLIVK